MTIFTTVVFVLTSQNDISGVTGLHAPLMSRLSSKKTHYVSILLFRLLRDRCYRADSSNTIHKTMCETPASVLSPVDSNIRIN